VKKIFENINKGIHVIANYAINKLIKSKTMKLAIKGFIAPKLNEKYSDCADNYADNLSSNKFAISDGVTKSFYSSVWSKLLVEKFVQKKELISKDTIDSLIKDCQEEWYKKVTVEVDKPDIPWFTKKSYVEKKFAMATFIGLQFHEKEEQWKWNAIGLGDSYLIFIPTQTEKEPEKWIEVATMENSKEPVFDNYPNYYASIGNQHKGEACFIEDQDLVEGTFYLMTDALAEWFFNEKETAIEKIKKWKSQDDYIDFIADERADKLLKDDDSAIMIIEVSESTNTLITPLKDIANLQSLINKEEVDEAEKAEEKKINIGGLSKSGEDDDANEDTIEPDDTADTADTAEPIEKKKGDIRDDDADNATKPIDEKGEKIKDDEDSIEEPDVKNEKPAKLIMKEAIPKSNINKGVVEKQSKDINKDEITNKF
jgi:hypothetical protein